MVKSFVELTHEANDRFRSGKSDLKAMSKESEMKVADMNDTLSGFKFLTPKAVSYTHLRAHETGAYLVCRLLLEKKIGTNLFDWRL